MRINRWPQALRPFAALAALGMLAACDGDVQWGDGEGVPLAELDTGGTAPRDVALLGPDTVTISDGPQFGVSVDGDPSAVALVRFKLEDDTLSVQRADGESAGTATVRITMPAPRKLVLAGAGRMRSERVADEAEVAIIGSGTLDTPAVQARSLEVAIAGSGSYLAAGEADNLELSIAGSGSGRMDRLKAGRAEINIAGSGDAAFASDGEVEANVMGSGRVTVRGAARCTVNAVGSGSLVCERGTSPAG